MVYLDACRGLNHIGRLGENEHRTIRFRESAEILAMYPEATVAVLHKRHGDEVAYPVAHGYVSIDGGMVCWTIQSGDLAYVGRGQCEVVFYSGDVVAKSLIYDTMVDRALDGAGDPPEPWESWIEQVSATAADIAADRAAAEQAQTAAETVQGKAEDAEQDAVDAADAAALSASDAAQSATNAGLSATDAADSATDAAGSASAADESAVAAGESADAAAQSAGDADDSADTAAEMADLARGYAEGKHLDGTTNTQLSENNANYLLGLTRQVKEEAETLVGDLAKEATLQEVESEAQQSVELLEQILAEGHSSGDLNGYSLAPGAGNEVILTYTDPETEEASSVIMITNTTGQAIAEALEEDMLMWKGLVENAS